MIPKSCANGADWCKDHHLYLTLYKGAPPSAPGKLYVPASTEAVAVLFVENMRTKMKALWELKKLPVYAGITKWVPQNKVKFQADGKTLAWEHRVHPKKSDTVQLNGPQFLGKFTITTKGQSKDSGWTKESRTLFNQWTGLCRKARKTAAGRAKEEAFLAKLRAEEGIVAWNPEEERARKRRKLDAERAAEAAESEVEMDYDDDDLDLDEEEEEDDSA